MEGGRRSSTGLLLLALILAASSTNAAAAAQRRRTPTDGSYKLITVLTNSGDKVKLAMRADDSSIAGFANGESDWFAIQGSEDLLEPFRNRYGSGDDVPGHGLVNLLGALVKKNATS